MTDSENFVLRGQIVDLVAAEIFPGEVHIQGSKIHAMSKLDDAPAQYIVPGLIDAHVHIESSMLTPAEFGRLAVVHGTVATVSDPHEIANVLGVEGVKYMLANAEETPLKIHFGAPSCVPATEYETAGASIGVEEVTELLKREDIFYLSEMMNYPGVLVGDEAVLGKIAAAKSFGKPVDGHAPAVTGGSARAYAAAGITTDHECLSSVEAAEKISYGMKIMIREGSAAKNFDALINLLDANSTEMMFCTDDCHPNDLVLRHIDEHVRRALALGIDPLKVLTAACRNPVLHYGMGVGQLQVGDPADCIVVDNLENFTILATYINGVKVAEKGKTLLSHVSVETRNRFELPYVSKDLLQVPAVRSRIRVIEVMDGQLLTGLAMTEATERDGLVVSDTERDILKLSVWNRYQEAEPAIAFVKGFGLKKGALASSVAHDCHNVIALGVDDADIANAVNGIVNSGGGLAVSADQRSLVLPLPIAGLMSDKEGYAVAEQYNRIDARARELGSNLISPFMSLSFLALLVIPKLKLSDQGLFDGEDFEFVNLFV